MDLKSLPPRLRAAFQTAEERWASATVVNLRYHVSDEPRLTTEAAALATICWRAKADARAVLDQARRSFADSTQTEDARLVRAARFARVKLEGLEAALTRAFDDGEATAKSLGARIEAALAPPTSAGVALVHAELRGRFAAADPAKVLGEIRASPVSMAAVATAPRVLSGLSAEAYGAIRREYMDVVVPDEAAALDDLAAALRDATDAVAAAERDARAVIDFELAGELQARTSEERGAAHGFD